MELPDSLVSIGAYAFIGCYGLTDITITGKLDSIGEYSFAECRSLVSVMLPDSLTSISSEAFVRCPALESIYIPASVNNFGRNIFGNSSKLTVYGEEGSAAQKYAEENDIPFAVYGIASPKPTETPEPTTIPTSMPTGTPKPTETPEPSVSPTDKPVTPPDGYEYPYRIVDCRSDNNTVTVTAEKYNETEEAVMIFAEYESDGRLSSVKFEKVEDAEKNVFTKSFSYSGLTFGVFIWKGNMQESYSEKYSGIL